MIFTAAAIISIINVLSLRAPNSNLQGSIKNCEAQSKVRAAESLSVEERGRRSNHRLPVAKKKKAVNHIEGYMMQEQYLVACGTLFSQQAKLEARRKPLSKL